MEFKLGMTLKSSIFLLPLLLLTCLLFAGQTIAQTQFDAGYEAAQAGQYKKAITIWQSLANKGDPAAQYALGWLYESGQGVKQNYKTAVTWYKKAALQGNEAAQQVLGGMYAKGLGVKQNYKSAISYYTLAANQGDAISQFQLAKLYQEGLGTKKDIDKSLHWYHKAAEQGHINAQISLGSAYQQGRGVKQDYKKAIQYFEKAAGQNNALAQYELAHMYEFGRGEKQNYQHAIELYIKSAKNKYSPSAYKLGLIYEEGKGVEVDFKAASDWYRKAALQGNTNAQYRLGYLSQLGKGTDKNIQRAMEWYTQAAKRNHAQAYYQLAEIYEYGTAGFQNNIGKNLVKAFANYKKSSQLNNHLAHAKLAYFYENGIATDINTEKAIELYQKAQQDWAKRRLQKLLDHKNCMETSTTRLFYELISCANRPLMRARIAEQNIKVINENNLGWTDTYFTGAAIKGTSELTITYTREDLFAKALYTFVGRDNPYLIAKIQSKLSERFGEPDVSEGNIIEGKASFQWILDDGIILYIYRDWPDTTTYVEYQHTDNLKILREQQQQSLDKLFVAPDKNKDLPKQPNQTPLF